MWVAGTETFLLPPSYSSTSLPFVPRAGINSSCLYLLAHTQLDLLSVASRPYLIIHQDSLNTHGVWGMVLNAVSRTSLGAQGKFVPVFKIFPQLLKTSV